MAVSADQKNLAELVLDAATTGVAGLVINGAANAMWTVSKEDAGSLFSMPNIITIAGMYGVWKLCRNFKWLK